MFLSQNWIEVNYFGIWNWIAEGKPPGYGDFGHHSNEYNGPFTTGSASTAALWPASQYSLDIGYLEL